MDVLRVENFQQSIKVLGGHSSQKNSARTFVFNSFCKDGWFSLEEEKAEFIFYIFNLFDINNGHEQARYGK